MAGIDYQSRDDFSAERKRNGSLRMLSGPSKDEIWRQLAEQAHAEFVKGGWVLGSKVVAHVDPWTVTLDTYSEGSGGDNVTFTRLRAPYVHRDGFRFTIYRAGVFTFLGEMLGFHDIDIGDRRFDEQFVIKATDEQRVHQLLADPRVRELFHAQPKVNLQVKDDEGWFRANFPEGVDELQFTAAGVINDIARLEGLFELFAVLLHRLCQIGSACKTDPGVQL
jgi:hypothetical protein